MPYATAARRLLALLSCWLAAGPSVAAQEAATRPALGRGATEALAARYEASEHWVQKVVVLLSLNGYWHPAGVWGLLYWYALLPAHLFIFGSSTRAIARRAEER